MCKDFRIIPSKKFSELYRQLNKMRKIVHEQNKKFNQNINAIKENPEILELKNTMTDLKNSMESLNIRLGQEEEGINELENKTFKII